eukprot:6476470-Amphidinium_carterae.1
MPKEETITDSRATLRSCPTTPKLVLLPFVLGVFLQQWWRWPTMYCYGMNGSASSGHLDQGLLALVEKGAC